MKACVKWGCNISDYFDIKSGCAQGSILGPKMFNLVIDELLKRLEASHLGCRIGSAYAGGLAYADDLILLSSSGKHLQLMLNICCDFGAECDLQFNVKKSLWGFVGVLVGKNYPQFHLGFNDLPRVDSFVYLGVTFNLGHKLCVDFSLKCRKFLASVCTL